MLRCAEEIHRANGLLVVQNVGTWALGLLDCGADIVGARGNGKTLDVEAIRGHPALTRSNGRGISAGQRIEHKARSAIHVQPFDPVELADSKLADVKRQWTRTQAFPVAEHVTPEPFWTYDVSRQREYRALQVFGSLVQLAAELRSASTGPIPLRDSIRDRIERMREHDAMFDICPSL